MRCFTAIMIGEALEARLIEGNTPQLAEGRALAT
jgi:hypothetical protein